ncbi:hypothetical protein ACVR1I_03440 [Streptococcus cameli]
METIDSYFRKVYQSQCGNVVPIDQNERNLILKSFEEFNILSVEESSKSTLEIYDRGEGCLPPKIVNILEEIHNKIYQIERLTFLQIIVPKEIGFTKSGSYYCFYPNILNTGIHKSDNMAMLWNYDLIILVCSDVDLLASLGKKSYRDALIQTGEIRQIIKEKCELSNIFSIPFGYNKITKIAGLNAGTVLTFEVLGINL